MLAATFRVSRGESRMFLTLYLILRMPPKHQRKSRISSSCSLTTPVKKLLAQTGHTSLPTRRTCQSCVCLSVCLPSNVPYCLSSLEVAFEPGQSAPQHIVTSCPARLTFLAHSTPVDYAWHGKPRRCGESKHIAAKVS